MKKIISLFLCLILCLSLIPVSAFAEEDFEDPFIPVEEDEFVVESEPESVVDALVNEQVVYGNWYSSGGKWYFRLSNGSYVKECFLTIDGKTYYFNASGVMQTGWRQIGGYWYYFNSSGVMQTGWLKSGSKWFLLSTASSVENGRGIMLTGWQKTGGKWYYMNSSGEMQTGWKKISGKWYYLNSDGHMETGWKQIGGKWYYFDGSGAMKTGWVKSSGKWYYMLDDGSMATRTLIYDENWSAYYCVDENGVMVTNETWVYQGTHYHFGADGKCDYTY